LLIFYAAFAPNHAADATRCPMTDRDYTATERRHHCSLPKEARPNQKQIPCYTAKRSSATFHLRQAFSINGIFGAAMSPTASDAHHTMSPAAPIIVAEYAAERGCCYQTLYEPPRHAQAFYIVFTRAEFLRSAMPHAHQC
jgi:hypothetical protein